MALKCSNIEQEPEMFATKIASAQEKLGIFVQAAIIKLAAHSK